MHGNHLSPQTLLQLAPGIRTRFDMTGHVLVDAPDGTVVDIGPRGYAILSLFSRAMTLGNAIDRLEDAERSSTDFVPALSVINMLIEDRDRELSRQQRHLRPGRGVVRRVVREPGRT